MHIVQFFSALILCCTASAASLQQVSNYGGSSTNVPMSVNSHSALETTSDFAQFVSRYIYVPEKVTTKPALVVVIHSCQSSAQQYFQNSKIPWKQGSDAKGYITIWPSSPHSGTCWDVSSK